MDQGSAAEQSSLKRRRDELAAEVAELHWDLGGLAYEMALRDHFRLDLLISRAAALQERDTELAELERRLPADASGAPPQGPPTSAQTGGPGRSHGPLPGPGAAALLVLAMLGFGVLTGNVARGNPGARQARKGPLTVMLAAAQDGGGTAGESTGTSSASVAPAPPLGQPEATPSPAASEAGESKAGGAGEDTSTEGASGKGGGTGSDSTAGASAGGSSKAPATSKKTQSASPTQLSKAGLPPLEHVFLIMLADQPYAATFGPDSKAPYLSRTLERKGELLVRYYAVTHDELANEIALISGQGPTATTALNCPTFLALTPSGVGSNGQYAGNGCVYPSAVQTVGDQLLAKRLTWKVYAQDMEKGAPAEPQACRHPVLGAADPTLEPRPGDAFATYRDPFSYFAGAIDSAACTREDVGLGGLASDLKSAKDTPTLSYIVPNLCNDGHEAPCAPGAPAGLPAADAFLRSVVPEILASAAYKQGGLLVITTDQAPTTGPDADSSSCCEEPRFPGIPGNQPVGSGPAVSALPPPGGGQVGALLLSPFVKQHTVNQEPFDHFSLLRTIEDAFGLGHLGYAGLKGVGSFGATVFTGSQGG